MARRRSRSKSRSARGGGPSGAGLAFVVLIGATAAVIALNARTGANKGETVQPEPREDIFADVEPDVPTTRSGGTTTLLNRGGDLFPTDEAAWNEANGFAQRAEIALSEAIAAKDAGARELAKKKGAEAQELYSRALELANPWLNRIAAQFGRDDPMVKRVDRATQAWAKELVLLKKSAGM